MIPMEEILNKYLEASDEESESIKEQEREEPDYPEVEETQEQLEEPVFQQEQPFYQQVQEEPLAFDSRPPDEPAPQLFNENLFDQQPVEQEKIKVDLRNEDKNFFTDSE
jgi:hypothetical protein